MTEKRFMKIFLCLASLCTAPLLLGPAMLCPAGRAAPAAQRAAVQRAAPATQESARALGGGEAAAPWPEGVLQLRQQAVCGADGLYTVTLEAWAAGPLPEGDWPGGEAVLAYTLTGGLAFGPDTAVHAYAIDKTRSGWAAVKQECPDLRIAADAQAGTLRVSGFDYTARAVTEKPALDGNGHTTYGAKLVVRLSGLRADYAATFGGQGLPVGGGGVYTADPDSGGALCAPLPPAAVDVPLRCAYAPADQRLQPGEAVNFGYMINPPDGRAGMMPDGRNNAACSLCYTVSDASGPVAEYEVPAGLPVGAGRWTRTPDPAPVLAAGQALRYTVTVTLCAARMPAADPPPQGSAARLVLQSEACVTAEK